MDLNAHGNLKLVEPNKMLLLNVKAVKNKNYFTPIVLRGHPQMTPSPERRGLAKAGATVNFCLKRPKIRTYGRGGQNSITFCGCPLWTAPNIVYLYRLTI